MKKGMLELPAQDFTEKQCTDFITGLLKIISDNGKQEEALKVMDELGIKYTYKGE